MRVWIGVPLFLLLIAGPAIRSLAGEEGGGKAAPERFQDRVAARVNGAEITEKSVKMTMDRMRAGMGRAHSGPGGREELRKKALDMLIVQELVWQKAGSKVDREQGDRKIASLKARAGGEEEYRKLLEREGLTESDVAVIVEKNVVYDLAFQEEVVARVTVSEEGLRKEYEKEKEQFHVPEKVEVVDVVFFLETGEKESIERAAGILKRIGEEEGRDPFRLEPDGTFIVREIEVRKEKERELYEEAKKLKVGELSGVITTPDSLHIIQLRKFTPERQYTFDEARPSLEGKLKREAVQKRMQEWEAELKQGATIEISGNADGRK